MGNFGTIVFDLDGVLYVGERAIPGAAAALRAVIDASIATVFATNNASRLPEEVAAAIGGRLGVTVPADSIVTSAMAAADYLRGSVAAALVIGTPSLAIELERGGVATTERADQADAVVVGLDPTLTYNALKAATLAIAAGARLVATNVDPTYPTAEGLVPGAGAIVAALERASGVAAEVCGKPNRPMLDAVARRLGPGPVLMVGDRIDTDIDMGRAMGWSTALVMTGVTPPDRAAVEDVDHLLESVADLPAVLGLDPEPGTVHAERATHLP